MKAFQTIFLVFLGAIFLFVITDAVSSRSVDETCLVVDKHYGASRTYNGSGYGITSNGSLVYVNGTSHESEKFVVMVKILKSGKVKTINVSPETFYSTEIGQFATVKTRLGGITNEAWSRGIY